MIKFPDYLGPMAFGLRMGVVLPGMDVVEVVYEALSRCHRDGLLADGDVVCVTESIVARAQDNYVTLDDIAREIKEKLSLSPHSRVSVIFPIASRNRFSMILKGIARAVPAGEVVVQLSFPCDEVGNQIIPSDRAIHIGKDLITEDDLAGTDFRHPITGVNYIELYRETIFSEGANPVIILSNDPLASLDFAPGGVIAADIHQRFMTREIIAEEFANCITLDQVCNSGSAYSEWGLLGSNMSAAGKLKLAPRDGQKVVDDIKEKVKNLLGLDVEVLIYGDGAYKDPTSGIYELADPRPAFAATSGLDHLREGVKYKYLADLCFHEQGKNASEIEAILEESCRRDLPESSLEKEGTTPRRMEDILASLADLVSGSADAGTPVVLIKGFLR